MNASGCLGSALLLGLSACNAARGTAGDAAAGHGSAGDRSYRVCADAGAPRPSAGRFRHDRSALIAAAAHPLHPVQDHFGAPGSTISVEAKFTYGRAGKDLEDEPVQLWLDDCSGAAKALARASTDSDGRARFELTVPPVAGEYALYVSVDGDGSTGAARLFAWPRGMQIVVSDIDGTLTTSDDEVSIDVLDEMFEDLRDGDYVAAAYPQGPELTQMWRAKGYPLVYLTGRPYWLLDHTRAWLRDGGYAPGLVRTTDRHRDVLPTESGVGGFKAAFLQQLRDAGYDIVAAYGNATTDVWAYAQASIPPAQTFIIGPHAGAGGTVAIQSDWRAALPLVRDHAAATTPAR